ncbi:hypothetical protein H6P81_000501 [Aristolochia fimbriata]|uniref:Uncharacterized protein n=1 Tax=Aristolochia fimbriata TaxID=158543 RepID=A0AAV7F4J3_ARIFI|nr:hypothetical protein H6P81_000501 [Aristolochia fimbriata]
MGNKPSAESEAPEQPKAQNPTGKSPPSATFHRVRAQYFSEDSEVFLRDEQQMDTSESGRGSNNGKAGGSSDGKSEKAT